MSKLIAWGIAALFFAVVFVVSVFLSADLTLPGASLVGVVLVTLAFLGVAALSRWRVFSRPRTAVLIILAVPALALIHFGIIAWAVTAVAVLAEWHYQRARQRA